MTANSLYSNFVDAADDAGSIKNSKENLAYLSGLAGGIVRLDLVNELSAGAVYPIIGSTAQSHKFNFMNPASKALIYINGVFDNTNAGIKRSTADARIIDTSILLSELVNGLHFVLYSNENQQASTNDKDMGSEQTYIASYPAGSRNMEANFQGYPTPNKLSILAQGNGIGVYVSNYLTTPEFYYNGISLSGSLSNVSTVKSTNSIKLFSVENSIGERIGSSVRGYGYIGIGGGLSTSKAIKYSHLIRTLQGIKNRQ